MSSEERKQNRGGVSGTKRNKWRIAEKRECWIKGYGRESAMKTDNETGGWCYREIDQRGWSAWSLRIGLGMDSFCDTFLVLTNKRTLIYFFSWDIFTWIVQGGPTKETNFGFCSLGTRKHKKTFFFKMYWHMLEIINLWNSKCDVLNIKTKIINSKIILE